jgi:hypothetical protein
MRKFGYLLTVATAGLLAALGPAAAAAPAAVVPTLTRIALGGPPANPGDLLTSSLAPGTALSLSAVPGGPVGLVCQQSVWGGQLLANPPVGGLAVIRLLNPLTIAACGDNSPGVIGVNGVAVAGLPDMLQVTGVGAFPLQIVPAPAPLQIILNLNTVAGPVVCTYQAAPPVLMGNTALGAAPWKFVNQRFQLIAGPLPFCGAAGPQSFLTASYSPVIDTTAGGTNVFVN